MSYQRGWLRRCRPWAVAALLAVLVFGTVATAGLSRAASRQEQRDAAVAVDRHAERARWAISSEADRYVTAVAQVAAAVGAGSQVSEAEFARIVAPLRQRRLAGASGVVLVMPASDRQIAQLQAQWRRRGAAGLVLHPVPGVRQHAFSVLSESLDGKPGVPGRDLAQSTQIWAALQAASSTEATAVSDPYVLLKDRELPKDRQQSSFAIIAPIPGAAGQDPVGWVLLGMRGQDFADEVLRTSAQGLANITMSAGSTDQPVAAVQTGAAWVDGPAREVTVRLAQQQWVLHVHSTHQAASTRGAHLDTIIAWAGGLITILLALVTRIMLSSRWRALRAAQTAINELRCAEAGSRRDAGLLSAIMDSIGDGVGVVDAQGEFILHNAAAKAILGVQDDVTGPEPWQEHYGMFRPDGITSFPAAEMPLVRALAGEATDLVDMVIRNAARPEGVMISVTGRPVDLRAFGMEGRGGVAVFHDVTARRRLEASLRVQHDRYERLLGILSDLGEGVMVRTGYQITYANHAYTQLTGYSLQELLALPDIDILAADEQGLVEFANIGAQLSTGAQAEVHLTRIRHKDGHIVPVEVAAMRLDDPSLNTSERVYVVRDLSERRRAEIELAERASALQDANEELHHARAAADAASHAKSQFLTTMSHEIRTPLNGVLGFTALLAESPRHPDAPEWAATADAAGRALLDIVNNGLDLAKIEAGAIELESIELDLLDIARQAMLPCRLTAQDAGIDLRLLIGDGLACIRRADPVRLRQVMTNLISNAVKFTPAGSVTLALDGHDDQLRIRVIDTGIGMDAEQQQRLFTPFQQAATDTTRRYGGTGLGLSIAAGLVQAMGGTVSLTSQPGEGTTFTIELDLPRTNDRARETTLSEPVEADLAILSGLRVLVAEDNRTNQLVARAMLQKRGLRVDVVEDGQQAVTAALTGDYDAIFMDCQMPIMDGMEATRGIRAGTTGHHIPIIAMTANTYEEERQACLDAGMNDFLPKPWTAQQLTDVLTRLVHHHLSHPAPQPPSHR